MFTYIKKLGILFLISTLFTTSIFAQTLRQIQQERGLSDQDILAAVKTYTPTGKLDEYVVFSSGGQAGQLIVYGVPSMRILKYVGVFTPEPWQGWGFDKHSKDILAEGNLSRELTWGDTHHPALSETNGDYDGQYVFINDKANPRIAVIDLKYFETSQIVANPLFASNHGAAVVSPNTEYVAEVSQYAAPLDKKPVSLDEYEESYRGGVTYWKFDRASGKIDASKSFAVEFPPYVQDISDMGKLASNGWHFINSINTELYPGGFGPGNTEFKNKLPNEAGMSANDMDYMHVVNWQIAEKLYEDGTFTRINDFPVISIEDIVDAGGLFLVPEPKSPHGADVSPDGQYVIVSGKLDTHASVYSVEKMLNLLENKDFVGTDDYGIPILDYQKSLHRAVNLGLGPLHTQFGGGNIAYTSLYVESAIVKWDYIEGKVIEKTPIHYNVGHITAAEGDTVSPDGKYLISLNKLSLDRFVNVGPLYPQNHQLIDINDGTKKMQLIYDMPLPLGEPHYAQMIKADKLNPVSRYTEQFPNATRPGRERIERNGNEVTIYSTSIRSRFSPEVIEVKRGDRIIWHVTSLERAKDQVHGFTVNQYNVHGSLEPGETGTFEFIADEAGVFPFYCTEFCSALHLEMAGMFIVTE